MIVGFGPRQGPRVSIAALHHGEFAQSPRPWSLGDFIYVADVARALEALLVGDVRGTVNVASGQCVPVRMVVQVLGQLAGRTDLLAIGAHAMPPGEPLRLAADVDRLRAEVGFVAGYRLEEGLTATLDWWRTRLASEGHHAHVVAPE